jgi:uncharacterized membrane protein YcaP (DUF421 family)
VGSGQQKIQPFDWQRVFVGQAPAAFILETALRALMIYVVLLVAMRLLGKRTAAQLTLTELAVVVTLGAAVGVPMQVPERGMLPGFAVLAVAVLFQRGVNTLGFRSGKITRLIEGDVSILLRDGVLDLRAMKLAGIAREQIFAALRSGSIEQLGQVRRIYLEASGQLSTLRAPTSRPGLSIVPTQDPEIRQLQRLASGQWACQHCGNVQESEAKPESPCDRCHNRRWTEAMCEEHARTSG